MVIADLEIHSRFARACSKAITPLVLNDWAKRKGVNLLSTGDITHPLWRREIQKSVVEREAGFFVLKGEKVLDPGRPLSFGSRMTERGAPRFVLGGEVSLMFRQGDNPPGGGGRRFHLLFLAPSFKAVENLVEIIQTKGKLASDGRPILGLPCRDFALACHQADPDIMVIPAHIWTPWFGLLGSKSGFDGMEEAFGDCADSIKAYETGLSADPAMCWRVETLNKRVLVSGSDLHSPLNMMREATLLEGKIEDYNYSRLKKALSKVGNPDYWGTLEFYPQEGKYHADGHAACKVVLEPQKTNEPRGKCPSCGQSVTVGVSHRVEDLATHRSGFKPKTGGNVIYSVPLQEIIAEAYEKSKTAKSVQGLYFELTDKLGTEFSILHEIDDFPGWVPARVVQGIYAVRHGEVTITPGYDGLYGRVNIFTPHNLMVSFWDTM